MSSDPLADVIWLAVAIVLAGCVYQAARNARWHALFCDRCRVRRVIRANRRTLSSRAVEINPRVSGPAPAPVDTAAPPRRCPPAPSPGGQRPRSLAARPGVRHG